MNWGLVGSSEWLGEFGLGVCLCKPKPLKVSPVTLVYILVKLTAMATTLAVLVVVVLAACVAECAASRRADTWPCSSDDGSSLLAVFDPAWDEMKGCGLGDRLMDLWAFQLMTKARQSAFDAARDTPSRASPAFHTTWPCGTDWDNQGLAFCYDPNLLHLGTGVHLSLQGKEKRPAPSTHLCEFVPSRDIPQTEFWGTNGMLFTRFATVTPARLREASFVDAVANAAAKHAPNLNQFRDVNAATEKARAAYLTTMTEKNYKQLARSTKSASSARHLPRGICVHVRASDKALSQDAQDKLRTAVLAAADRAAQIRDRRNITSAERPVRIFTEDVRWLDVTHDALTSRGVGVVASTGEQMREQRERSLEDGARSVDEFFELSRCRVILAACSGWSTFVLAAALVGPVRTRVELFGLMDTSTEEGRSVAESIRTGRAADSEHFYVRKFAAWREVMGQRMMVAHETHS